ncbi:MAG TPA: hypothetical protein VHG51_09785 [Longimicrobiaceae bacterium]|nr:hypothetical protein [Longimicrobiaceae bacterium]
MRDDVLPTEERLAEIEERLRRATPGPWACKDRLGGGGCFVFSEETFHVVALQEDDEPTIGVPLGRPDAELIARAREDLPLLLAEVRRLRALAGDGARLLAV